MILSYREDNMKKKAKKLNVVGAVVTVVLLLFVVAMFVINMLFYKDTAAPSFFGKYYVYITGDEQKIEGIEKNIAVICDSTYMNNVQVGNVVLAEVNDEKDYAVLRIVGMDETTYTLKSDYSEIDDTITLPKSDAVALCYSKSAGFGGFVDFATTNAGVVILIILPLTIIIVMKAWSILGKEKDDEQKPDDVSEKKKKEKKAKEDAKRKKADAEKSETESQSEPESEPIQEENEVEQQEEVSEENTDDEIYSNISDSDEDDVYLIKKDENGDTAIISADDEDEKTEPDVDITQYMNPSEEAEQPEEDYEPVISVSENNSETVSDNDFSEPKLPETDEIIYRNDVPSELPDIISDDVKPSEPVVKTVEKTVPEPVKTVEKKTSAPSHTHKKSNNRYTSNKYATGARRNNSRTSVDDLLKTIDSEKSKIHK